MKRRYIDIVYEDRDIIAVNKPRGVVVVGDRTIALADDVRAYIVHKFPGAKSSFVRPLHRLDKETTGLVLFAKSAAGMKLAKDVKLHKIKRRYIAVVEGYVDSEDGTVDKSLEKGDFGHGKKVSLSAGDRGKRAVTHYHVVERYDKASLLNIRLETGFTHQIRVHMASIGYPLVGDKIYNPHGTIAFPRQALHACEADLVHPSSGKKLQLKAPLPKDMKELIDGLRMSS